MDTSLYRWINRLADRTGWAHGLFTANAGYGIALFAILSALAPTAHARRPALNETLRCSARSLDMTSSAMSNIAITAANAAVINSRSLLFERHVATAKASEMRTSNTSGVDSRLMPNTVSLADSPASLWLLAALRCRRLLRLLLPLILRLGRGLRRWWR